MSDLAALAVPPLATAANDPTWIGVVFRAARSVDAVPINPTIVQEAHRVPRATPSGSRGWRLKYRFAGKEKRISLGVYPEVSLEEAREKCDAARKQITAGIDPSDARKLAKIALRENAEKHV